MQMAAPTHGAEPEFCGCCGLVLVNDGVQVQGECGRSYHFLCLREHVAKKSTPSCKECAAADRNCIDIDALQFLEEETTTSFQQYPSSVELWVSSELRLLRPTKLLKAIPEVLFNFSGLRCLDITAHPVVVLPSAIGKLQSLHRLVLIALYLQDLPDELCTLRNLEQLFACSCNLRKLPPKIATMEKLRRFYFDSNRLKSLPEEMPRWIGGIHISGNFLERIPDSIGECSQIEDFQAYANRFTSIPQSICNLKSLKHLILHGNCLRALPEQLGSLSVLESVLVADNLLESLPDSLGDLKHLRWLYAYNNHLHTLPSRLLHRARGLERVLLEANPLTAPALVDLLDKVPPRLRVLGVDIEQVDRWCSTRESEERVLPPSVIAGQMLPWGRLYAKFTLGSQLARARGQRILGDGLVRPKADVLVVAFSASQGEPEWAGVLGQALRKEVARGRISRGPPCTFSELHEEVHGRPPSDDEDGCSRAAAALWSEYCQSTDTQVTEKKKERAQKLQPSDCDVLFLCDTNAQWYFDVEGSYLGVEEKLSGFVTTYKRVLFLGASMGGFGALSHAYLADTVAVFGPQVDLCRSHLRPGMLPEQLRAASQRLQKSVQRALAKGTRVEFHVAMEDHLVQARWLSLPPTALVVHPICGRIARLMERAGILVSLLAQLIIELQDSTCLRPHQDSVTFAATCAEHSQAESWNWRDKARRSLLLARWEATNSMTFLEATPWELSLVSRKGPWPGSWFCPCCSAVNEEGTSGCRRCVQGAPPVRSVANGGREAGRDRRAHECTECGARVAKYASCCPSCTGTLALSCAFCGRTGFSEKNGRLESIGQQWYCTSCWEHFERHCETMRRQLPQSWFVEGGQKWEWRSDGPGRSGFIEFGKNGKLRTSWGDGSWSLNGSTVEVLFGNPMQRWKLVRNSKGFVACQCGDGVEVKSAKAHGWPLEGAPSPVSVFGSLPRWALVLLAAFTEHCRNFSAAQRRLLATTIFMFFCCGLGISARKRRALLHG